jgi:3-hydroxyacyl-CoA dehydrogenase/enoyl-CoA hydratase/3-hydroxybutyryl-CoA epimerase
MAEQTPREAAEGLPGCRHWQSHRDAEGVVWLRVDHAEASTNVLSREVLEELESLVDALMAMPPAGLAIYSGKESGFIAGADIKEFPHIGTAREAYELTRRGQRVLASLESLPCITVAVIKGYALGGGLEVALACDRRLAIRGDKKTLGLPEVQLGLHPGFGGTVRTVRLVGVRHAMSLMLTGKPITPLRGHAIGLVDQLADPDGWRDELRDMLRAAKPKRAGPALADRILNWAPVRPLLARMLRRQVARRARADHYPAPYAMINLWRRHGAHGEAAYDAEARSFGQLVETDTSRNLVRVYFLQERLKRTAGRARAKTDHVHVVGAGVMGGDIASWCALKGCSVTLQDREMHFIEPALERAEKLFARRVAAKGDRAATRRRLVADVTGEGVSQADIVIEAIFEDRDAKQALYRDLEPRMKDSAILATNTSSIPLENLAPCLENRGRLVGLHFFNPVAKLPLVEVVSAPGTSRTAAETALSFARQIGKLPLQCRSHPGFLVNRILAPYMAEAMELIREGVPPVDIDRAAVNFGMPMGPVELADSVGLDVALHVAKILSPVIGREVAPELEELVAAGHLGQKTGRGFYQYQDRRPMKPKSGKRVESGDIQDRLVLSLLNEAASCLSEGVVADEELVDAGVIFGTGFAPFRGGPLHYARVRGVTEVVAALRRLQRDQGERFKPSDGWGQISHNA